MAMSLNTGGNEEPGTYRPIAEINVTPFVDVMLVLLIIFMVAAPLMMVGVPIQLPKTAANKVSQPRQPVIVTITRDNKLYIQDKEVPVADLGARLAELNQKDGDAVIYLRGDRAVVYGQAMEILGTINQAGFSKVSLIAQGANATPASGPQKK